MKLGQFTAPCVSRYATIKELEAQKDKIVEKLSRLYSAYPVNDMFKNLAAAIAKKIKAKGFSVYGPYGLGSRSCLTFKMRGTRERSVTVSAGNLMGDGSFNVIDLKTNTKTYPPNSLGEINGLNHPPIVVSPKMSLDTFIRKYVK